MVAKTLRTALEIFGLADMTAIAIRTSITAYSTVVTPLLSFSLFIISLTSSEAILDETRGSVYGSKVCGTKVWGVHNQLTRTGGGEMHGVEGLEPALGEDYAMASPQLVLPFARRPFGAETGASA